MIKLLVVALVILLLVGGTSMASAATKAPEKKVTKSLEIDADIYSPTFGEPIDAQAGGQE